MRGLYDPPFFFELNNTCLTVYKKTYENEGYTKYRILSLPDAQRIYPDVYEVLATDSPNKRTSPAVAQLSDIFNKDCSLEKNT